MTFKPEDNDNIRPTAIYLDVYPAEGACFALDRSPINNAAV